MSPADRHQHEWADAVGAYLLESLPEPEREAFEQHLAGCETCQEDVDMLRVASDALPASVRQLSPPPELRDRIMAVVQAEAELLAAASGPRADLPERAPRRTSRLAGLLMRPGFAVAAVALLLVVGGVSGAFVARDGGERVVVAQVDRGQAETASARLVIHERDSKLEVADMPPPPEGRVYQVWIRRAGREAPEPTPALFAPRTDGTGSVAVPGSLRGVEAVLVTHEPRGGSERPSRKPIITAPIT